MTPAAAGSSSSMAAPPSPPSPPPPRRSTSSRPPARSTPRRRPRSSRSTTRPRTSTSEVGFSIAGIGNYFGTTSSSTKDLAIGAPGLNSGAGTNSGAVFTVSGNFINNQASGANIDLSTLYSGSASTSANSTGGIEYTATAAGSELGFSVSTAGNFDGETGTNGSPTDDLLMGAPGASGGLAYLVYGNQPFLQNELLGSTQPLTTLGEPLLNTQGTLSNALQGAIFGDNSPGDEFGFSVATAGDFNNDGVDDLMIGAPGYSTDTGYVTVIYGLAGTATTSTTTRLNGNGFLVSPTATSTAFSSANFIGTGINMFTGFSTSPSGHLQFGTSTAAEPIADVLIGAPGPVGATAYLIPGTAAGATALVGPQLLSTTNTTLDGSEFTASGTSDPAITTGGFATSVNARNLIVDPKRRDEHRGRGRRPRPVLRGSLLDPQQPGQPADPLADAGRRGLCHPGRTARRDVIDRHLHRAPAPGRHGHHVVHQHHQFEAAHQLHRDQQRPAQPVDLVALAPDQLRAAAGPVRPPAIPDPARLPRPRERRSPPRHDPGQHPPGPGGHGAQRPAIGKSENKYAKVETLPPKLFARGKTHVGTKTTFTHKRKVIPTNLQTETYPG